MKYNSKSKEDKQKEVDVLVESIDKKVEDYTYSPEGMKEYLSFMSKFYNYSLNNSILIEDQFRGAEAVGSYDFWKEKGYTVNRGEKGIKILVPTKLADRFINENGEVVLISKANEKEKINIKDESSKIIAGRTVFKQGYVFDVSQTNVKVDELPEIFPNRWLEGNVKDFKTLYKGMENVAKSIGVSIIEPKSELGAVKGVSYTLSKEVALNPRNSELQNVKTLLHELTHAKLHTKENLDEYSTHEKEFQAELTACAICSYFGIDTSDYSLSYIKTWTNGKDLKDKKELLKEVRETSKEYIDILEETLIQSKDKELESFFINEELKDPINVYYKDNPEEYNVINSVEEFKEYIIEYTEPFFEHADIDSEDQIDNVYDNMNFKDEVENKWGEKEIMEWSMVNNMKISKVNDKEELDFIKEKNIEVTNDNIIELGFFEVNGDLDIKEGFMNSKKSFVKKGTEFIVESYDEKNKMYELHFESREGNKYKNEFADNYYFGIDEINKFSRPTEEAIKKYKEGLLKENDFGMEEIIENESKERNVDVINYEKYNLKKGEKITFAEANELFKLEVENGVSDKSLELNIKLANDVNYNFKARIDNNSPKSLVAQLESSVEDTICLKKIVNEYLYKNSENVLDKNQYDKEQKKYNSKEMELEL